MPAEFEPAIAAREGPQAYALDGAATKIDLFKEYYEKLRTCTLRNLLPLAKL